MATAQGNDRDEGSVDVEAHRFGEAGKDDFLGRTFPQHHEAREVELRIGAHGLADEFRRVFLADREFDRADAGRSIVRFEPKVSDLRWIHSGKDAWGMAGDDGLRLRRLCQILNLPNDAGEIEGGEIVLGLDTFQYAPEEQVREGLAIAGFTSGYSFLKMFSTDVSAEELLSHTVSKPRFISIDGSHEKDDVHWDMRLAEQLLATNGLVSVDDFLNPVTLGVNDGVHAFFAQPRNLEPVLFTSNKLFLSRPGQAPRYRSAIEDMLIADNREQAALNFQSMSKLGRNHVEQNLWGKKVLVA